MYMGCHSTCSFDGTDLQHLDDAEKYSPMFHQDVVNKGGGNEIIKFQLSNEKYLATRLYTILNCLLAFVETCAEKDRMIQ